VCGREAAARHVLQCSTAGVLQHGGVQRSRDQGVSFQGVVEPVRLGDGLVKVYKAGVLFKPDWVMAIYPERLRARTGALFLCVPLGWLTGAKIFVI
jgi:hypothetical protein